MIADLMPPRKATENEPRKVTVCGKVAPDIATALEELAQQISDQSKPATLTLSQLVSHILTEYVDTHKKKQKRN